MFGENQNYWITTLITAAVGVALTYLVAGAGKGLRALAETLRAWKARENESDIQAAQRVAGSTQRLVVFVGIVVLITSIVVCLTGSFGLAWAIWVGKLPVFFALPLGALLGNAWLCWTAMRFLEKVAGFLAIEERERLSRMN